MITRNGATFSDVIFGDRKEKLKEPSDDMQIILEAMQQNFKLFQDRTTFAWYLYSKLELPFTCVKVSVYKPTVQALLGRGIIKRVNRGEDRQTDFQYILKEG